jgi:hypothetical protein
MSARQHDGRATMSAELIELMTEMIKGIVPHAWIDNFTAQYYIGGKFYVVSFSDDFDIVQITSEIFV